MAAASASLSSPLRVQRAEEKVLAPGRVKASSTAFNAVGEGQDGGPCAEWDASTDSTAISISALSFATDLLFNLDDVRAECAAGLATHSSLVALLKSRISLERTYAQELSKMARSSRLEEAEHGTMKEALGALKAQYLNTSVQHSLLAKNLEEDVLRPIETLYAYNNQKTQSLARRIHGIKKEVKVRKDYGVFDKHFRDASAAFSAAMASGFSSTSLECQYHHRLSQMGRGEYPSNNVASTHTKQSGTVALKTLNNNSHKLVNWLRSSEQHRKEHLANNAVKVLEVRQLSICSFERECEGKNSV
ncbi:hypothetical protein BBJ28_00000144 [Nothophytophthora sp. Chile5]|nr:hypothetical protein BBJ28_00000144 [Nothophytophthora sp. Chile5]